MRVLLVCVCRRRARAFVKSQGAVAGRCLEGEQHGEL